MVRWRIGLVQIAPELGQVEKNTRKLLDLTSKLKPGKLDLLCLPEMVLTGKRSAMCLPPAEPLEPGYTFPSSESIKPYLETPRSGVTSRLCSELSKRLCCHVIAGYPESLDDEELPGPDHAVGYNSAIIYGPDGRWHGRYRKTNLFETDMTWARRGNGFSVFDLGGLIGRMSLGICMDLNPFPPAIWTSREGPYELADFALDNNTRLLVVLCAWLDSKDHPDEQWDRRTIDYWLARLLPLWGRVKDQQVQRGTIVVICNRAGAEGDTLFAGTSTILKLSQHQPPEVVGLMGRGEEGVRLWEVTL